MITTALVETGSKRDLGELQFVRLPAIGEQVALPGDVGHDELARVDLVRHYPAPRPPVLFVSLLTRAGFPLSEKAAAPLLLFSSPQDAPGSG
jgi:hypothetical protein